MSASDDQVNPHMARFVDMLDGAFRRFGVTEGLPSPLRDAVVATPRHRFVHRFRVSHMPSPGSRSAGPLRDSSVSLTEALPVIYSDAVMRHVDAAGEPLPSSNSQPSYVLFLLQLLGLERGQNVLEIGSGSGWLAAVMARLVGTEGRVTGIELIPDLAAQSRTDLAALGRDNVRIITGDGTRGNAAGAPYDRIIVTAATWDVPPAVLEQVAEGGCVLIPIELRCGDGCAVTLLRRHGKILVAERTVQGWFVPLLGGGQDGRNAGPEHLPTGGETARYSLPLCASSDGGGHVTAKQFRAFLGRTQPGFVPPARGRDGADRSDATLTPFGVADAESGSMALWEAGEVVIYGNRMAATQLADAFALWASLGLPGLRDFSLEVHPAMDAPAAAGQRWVEQRGDTALVWRLRPELGNWRSLVTVQAAQPLRSS